MPVLQLDDISEAPVVVVVPGIVAVLVLAVRADPADCGWIQRYLACGHHFPTQRLCLYYFLAYYNFLRPLYPRAHS